MTYNQNDNGILESLAHDVDNRHLCLIWALMALDRLQVIRRISRYCADPVEAVRLYSQSFSALADNALDEVPF